MLRMTIRAARRERLIGVMNRAVVARETGGVSSFCGKRAHLLHVAGGAFSFENAVGLGHLTAGIHTMVTGEIAPNNPNEREQRQQ
jgi:hypothetical protein